MDTKSKNFHKLAVILICLIILLPSAAMMVVRPHYIKEKTGKDEFPFAYSSVMEQLVTNSYVLYAEEFLVRGLILGAFAQLLEGKRGQISVSVFSSALIFGLLHFCNLTYQTFPATLQQVIYAAVIGVALGVVRVVTNGLVFPVILHSLIDFKPDVLEASELMNWSMLTIVLVLF